MVELNGPAVGIKDETNDPEFLRAFRTRLRQSRSGFKDWLTLAEKYFRAYAGNPWPDEDREHMEGQERTPVSFNYALTTINTVLGQEMSDRKEIQFKGNVKFDLISQVVADWKTQLVRYWWQKSDGHRHESSAILDMLVSGYGWNEGYVDDTQFPFRVKPSHVDCWEMRPDPRAKDDNLLDARFLIREREYTLDEVEAKWPKKATEVKNSFGPINADALFPSHANEEYEPLNVREFDEETVTVWEYQFKKSERYAALNDPQSGKRIEMPIDEFKEYSQQLQMAQAMGQAPQEIQHLEFPRAVYYKCFFAGGSDTNTIMLEKPKRLHSDCFTYNCITGFKEKDPRRGTTRFFGMMHLIYEPQMWADKVLSTIIEMMGRGSKGGGMIKTGAVDDIDQFLNDMATPGNWAVVNDLSPESIRENKPMNWPQGMDMLMHTAVNAIPQVTAVTEFTKGTSTRERSNLLISNYQQQSEIVLTPIKDPITGFRIQMGRLMSKLIERYVSKQDINAILSEPVVGVTHHEIKDPQTGKKELQPIVNEQTGQPVTPYDLLADSKFNDYDTVTDIGQATSTEKQHLWQILTQTGLLQQLIETQMMPEELVPEFLKLLPVNGDLALKLGDKAEEKMEQQQLMQTVEGITQIAAEMSTEEVMQLVQSLAPVVEEAVQEQQKQQEQQPQQAPQGPPQQ